MICNFSQSAEANAPVETPEQKLERKKKSKADRKMFSDHNFSERPWESETERAQFQQLLEQQGGAVSDYWRKKYETDAKRNWDIFYKRFLLLYFISCIFCAFYAVMRLNSSRTGTTFRFGLALCEPMSVARIYCSQREFGELDKAAKDKKRYRLFEVLRPASEITFRLPSVHSHCTDRLWVRQHAISTDGGLPASRLLRVRLFAARGGHHPEATQGDERAGGPLHCMGR